MAAASVNARYDEKHHGASYHDGTFTSWAPKRTPSHPFESREGVTLWVSAEDLTPEDDFLRSPSTQSVEGERKPEHP